MLVFIYSTFPNKKEAQEIGLKLVQQKLVGCINIFPINSIYRWKNKIEKDREWVMLIKTKKQNFKKIEKFILERHSYEIPCIIEIPLGRITKKYTRWLSLGS